MRGGFVDRATMMTTAGVVGGFFVPDFIMRHMPKIQALQSPTGRIVGKAVIGVVAGGLAKRFISRQLAGAMVVGSLASAAMDFIYQFRGAAGAGAIGPAVNTQVGPVSVNNNGNVRSLTPSGVAGFIDDDTGELLNGFVDDDGLVLDGLGDVLGEVNEYADDDMVTAG